MTVQYLDVSSRDLSSILLLLLLLKLLHIFAMTKNFLLFLNLWKTIKILITMFIDLNAQKIVSLICNYFLNLFLVYHVQLSISLPRSAFSSVTFNYNLFSLKYTQLSCASSLELQFHTNSNWENFFFNEHAASSSYKYIFHYQESSIVQTWNLI